MWKLHGIEPEVLDYRTMKVLHAGYQLRPEIIESAFYLYRATHDARYLEMGRGYFEAIVEHCRVDAGYTVVMPSLFGTDGEAMTAGSMLRSLRQVCISREFTKLRRGETTPVAGWLRSLARSLHDELGGPGVGAIGMCFTGGFALAMMVDESVTAPVLCQPSTPFPVTPARSRDVNLSPADLAVVKGRCAAGQQVLGVRFRSDPAVGKRFETLTAELGDAFIRVELDGKGHSTVTTHRRQEAVDAVLAFLADHLGGATA